MPCVELIQHPLTQNQIQLTVRRDTLNGTQFHEIIQFAAIKREGEARVHASLCRLYNRLANILDRLTWARLSWKET